MATIAEYINPLTGLPEQVDKLDHTAQEIDDAVGRSLPGAAIDAAIQAKPNPNLLDNWHFGNPVNQRGQTEYTGLGYTIDRWRSWADVFSLNVVDNGIKISETIYQYFEPAVYRNLWGKHLTTSILFADGTLFSRSFVVNSNNWFTLNVNSHGINSVTFGINSTDFTNLGNNFFRIMASVSGTLSDAILAVKLELGSQQTLAHQDADGNWVLNEISAYAKQLAQCQRYYQLYSAAEQRPAKAVDCRPTMRVDPSQGTITIDGTTYYYNTTDL